MKRIKDGFLLPSAACAMPRNRIHGYLPLDKAPRPGISSTVR